MILKKSTIFSVLFALTVVFQIQGQEKLYNGNPDTSFETARKLAFNDQRKQAQDTLVHILTKYPNYSDIRTFLATTYSWDGDYKKARKEFAYVIKNDLKNKENWIAAIKNESWSNAYYEAITMADNALKVFPDDAEILLLKASALENIKKPLEASTIVEAVLAKNPEDSKALAFKASLDQSLRKNAIGLRSVVDVYSEVFDPMQLHTLNYSRLTPYGSIITKLNFNRRFNENGVQFEVDMYPKIAKGLYAYVNFGVADSFLFPDIRYGAELHQSLPYSLEVSAGFRALQYDNTTLIYTGSLGWYTGNSYWSLRPYLTPGDGGLSTSGLLNYRRYRANADNYWSTSFSMGFSPEIYQFKVENNENTIINLQSQRFNLSYFFTTHNNKNAWGAQFDLTHQEISFDPGSYFWIYSFTLSWDMRFK
ncbi:YaiO family outer membrane beta-barrel protein [Flavobacterium faecale]|uniref:YaiO family outer membrane beta-barrel protein n=1 Tax=Flavobacterium faecale TaxID=1355330 RepID=UPI003AAC7F0C